MEIGTVLYQQDVQGIPRLPTLKGAVEVKLPNADVDAAAKWGVNEYNNKKVLFFPSFLQSLTLSI